jgi:hypothetical protein
MPAMTEVSKGVNVSSLNPGSVLDVGTKNHRYRIECVRGDEVRISGHPTICPGPTAAQILGSSSHSWGDMEEGLVCPGKHLVFQRLDEDRAITTSAITDIRVQTN